jgi:tetrahydromethanopterin S-methyltransferase subunit G
MIGEAMDLSKLKIPAGSLVLDAALMLGMFYGLGQVTERLENISKRVETVEAVKIQPEADRRIAVIEAQMANQTERLKSIESKLDRVLEKR